jgi:hypothetical protein
MQIKPLPLLRLKGMTLSTILVPMLEIKESTKNKPVLPSAWFSIKAVGALSISLK